MSVSAILAPPPARFRAMALPIPCALPVTIATFSSRVNIVFTCFENLCAEGTLECGGLTPPWD
jgi:hypothetical protein